MARWNAKQLEMLGRCLAAANQAFSPIRDQSRVIGLNLPILALCDCDVSAFF